MDEFEISECVHKRKWREREREHVRVLIIVVLGRIYEGQSIR